VPASARGAFHFRYNSPTYRSEYQQWAFMRDNTSKWRHLGLSLREISRPGDSIAMGAIGCLGFYSGLDVYDYFGLVTPRVAHLPSPSRLNSPGHDKFVGPDFFLPQRPTYLRAKYFNGPTGRREAEESLRRWQHDYAEHGYSARLIERSAPEAAWIVLLERADRG